MNRCGECEHNCFRDKNGDRIHDGTQLKHGYNFGGGKGVAYIRPAFSIISGNSICREIDPAECEIIPKQSKEVER